MPGVWALGQAALGEIPGAPPSPPFPILLPPDLIVGVPLLPGHQGDYFFMYGSEMEALLDPVVGPKLFNRDPMSTRFPFGLQLPNAVFPVLLYKLGIPPGLGFTGPFPGWWCCICEPYPLDIPLLLDLNLQFVLDREAMFGPNSAVVANRMGDGSAILGHA